MGSHKITPVYNPELNCDVSIYPELNCDVSIFQSSDKKICQENNGPSEEMRFTIALAHRSYASHKTLCTEAHGGQALQTLYLANPDSCFPHGRLRPRPAEGGLTL